MTITELQKMVQSVMPDVEFVVDQDTGEVIIETGMVIADDGELVSEVEFALANLLDAAVEDESFERVVAYHCNFDDRCKDYNCVCNDDAPPSYWP